MELENLLDHYIKKEGFCEFDSLPSNIQEKLVAASLDDGTFDITDQLLDGYYLIQSSIIDSLKNKINDSEFASNVKKYLISEIGNKINYIIREKRDAFLIESLSYKGFNHPAYSEILGEKL